MHSRQVFLLMRMVLIPLIGDSPVPLSLNLALRISKSSKATFLFDMAKTPPRFFARKDFPSPEMDEEMVITFFVPPEVKKSRLVRNDLIASLVIDLGLSCTRIPR